ncbi:MAG: alpha/beta hydrolase [Planctomycetota bacterium]
MQPASPPPPRVAFLGGNGHSSARLDAVRAELARGEAGVELVDVAYPGFEGRPRAAGFEAFLAEVQLQLDAARLAGAAGVYATGIGALFALSLRARSGAPQLPLLIQGAVLWGLEQRLFPRLMRGPMPRLVQAGFRVPAMQKRFARKYFERAPAEAERKAFFDGYAGCAAFPDFFRWLTPALLRELERSFAAEPERLARISAWWGGRDRVVGVAELEETQRRLGTSWPVRVFPVWGHYPMIDAPAEWARALEGALEEELGRDLAAAANT